MIDLYFIHGFLNCCLGLFKTKVSRYFGLLTSKSQEPRIIENAYDIEYSVFGDRSQISTNDWSKFETFPQKHRTL